MTHQMTVKIVTELDAWRHYMTHFDYTEKEASDGPSDSDSDNNGSESDMVGETPRLPCLVGLNSKLESGVPVAAYPDSGTSMSLISEDFAKKVGVRILRTSYMLYSPTDASIELLGAATIFVKVEGVSAKRLKVLVLKTTDDSEDDELLIGYRDLITLRVLAANFPNQVKNKEAPLLPHPYGNTKKTPYLTCSVSGKGTYGIGTIEVTVKAIPDTGCSGFSSISENFAKKSGIEVLKTSFQYKQTKVLGLAWICIEIEDKIEDQIYKKRINKKVMVDNGIDDMLLCWKDLIDLGVLAKDFPKPASE